MRQGPLPVREYTDARKLIADARALRLATFAKRPPKPAPAPVIEEPPAPVIEAAPEPVKPPASVITAEAIIAANAQWAAEFTAVQQATEPGRNRKRIIADIAKRHGLTSSDILGAGRSAPVVAARHEAIAAVYDANPGISFPAMGRIFGKDHTTILHALSLMGRRPPLKGRAPRKEPIPAAYAHMQRSAA